MQKPDNNNLPPLFSRYFILNDKITFENYINDLIDTYGMSPIFNIANYINDLIATNTQKINDLKLAMHDVLTIGNPDLLISCVNYWKTIQQTNDDLKYKLNYLNNLYQPNKTN